MLLADSDRKRGKMWVNHARWTETPHCYLCPKENSTGWSFRNIEWNALTVQAGLSRFLSYSLPWNVKRSEHNYLSLSLGKRIHIQINGSHSLIYESHIPPNSSHKHNESICCPSVTVCIWFSLKIFKTNRTRPKMFLRNWRVTHSLLSWAPGM